MELAGKAALVTGASRGIGRGIARGLAAAGCDVVVSYVSDKRSGEEVAAELRTLGRKSVAVCCDISVKSNVVALFDEAEKTLGRLDIVVANAGVELVHIPFVEYTEDQYDSVFDVNAKGTFFTMQEAAKRVRDQGRIIVISSNTTSLALPSFAVYGASKLAPKHFVEVLAKEIGPRGVTVNSISPGITKTAGVFASTPDDDPYLQEITAATPLRRLAMPEDIADAVVLLASDRAAFITGQHLDSDGGAAL